MNELILRCQNLSKTYYDGHTTINVLEAIDLTIQKSDCIAIVGPSGSGKSTLLHLLGGLDQPTHGQVFIQDTDWQGLTEKQRCQIRNQTMGFVYQFHHLLPEFSALENVCLPLLIGGASVREAQEKATAILNEVGLSHRIDHKPAQLSGGERQRVAIARALVHQPRCVLADEPTGNLDQTTAMHVFDLMLELNQKMGTALVIVTHDKQLSGQMNKKYTLKERQLKCESTA
jgi:lipoprotein-releasing system ATP-binding protein